MIVLDVMLPGISGLEVCRILRDVDGSDVPIIMLTALDDTDDRVAGLQTGADDYIGKPFSVKELALRVGSVLRRARTDARPDKADAPLGDGDLRVDPVARDATPRRRTAVASRPGSSTCWSSCCGTRASCTAAPTCSPRCGAGTSATTRPSLSTSSACGTRSNPLPAQPRRIVTVYGLGYRYDPEDVVA